MLAPKRRFQSAYPDIVRAIADVTASDNFQTAADAALLQIVADLPSTTDPVEAAALYHRVLGARIMLNQLLTVASPIAVPTRPASSANLSQNH